MSTENSEYNRKDSIIHQVNEQQHFYASESNDISLVESQSLTSFIWDVITVPLEMLLNFTDEQPENTLLERIPKTPSPPIDQLEILPNTPPPTKYTPIISNTGLLTSNLLYQLLDHLPPIQKTASKIERIFSIEKHGISLSSLYNQTQDQTCKLILIMDDNGVTTGAFASHTLEKHSSYYGNGLTFLFQYVNETALIYPSTGTDEYYILCQDNYIAFGGGDGTFGLWVSEGMESGSWKDSSTFSNGLYIGGGSGDFKILKFEVWEFIV